MQTPPQDPIKHNLIKLNIKISRTAAKPGLCYDYAAAGNAEAFSREV